jgi:hypothetical protein
VTIDVALQVAVAPRIMIQIKTALCPDYRIVNGIYSLPSERVHNMGLRAP